MPGLQGDRPWFNILLVAFPLAFISNALNWPAGATFALSLVAMMPLAERLGFCTESLADVSACLPHLANVCCVVPLLKCPGHRLTRVVIWCSTPTTRSAAL